MPPQLHGLCLSTIGVSSAYVAGAVFLFFTATSAHPLAGFLAPFAVLAGMLLVRFPFVGVAAILLFSPIDAFLDQITPGIPAMKVLAAATFCGLLLQLARDHVYFLGRSHAFSPVTVPALRMTLLFLLWAITSSFFAEDKAAAMDSLRRLTPLLLLYVSVATLTDSLQKFRVLFAMILIGTILSALVGIYDNATGQALLSAPEDEIRNQWHGYQRSAGASNLNVTTTAALLLTGVTMAAFAATMRHNLMRSLGVSTILAGSAAIVLSLTRSASLGLLLLAAWLSYRFRHHKVTHTLILLSPLLIFSFLQLAPDPYLARFLTLFGVGEHDITLNRRMSYHVIGLDLLISHPIFGVGLGNFPDYFMNFDYRWIEGRTFTPRVLHNLLLSVFAETGFIGGCLFLGIVTASLSPTIKRLKTVNEPVQRALLEATLTSTIILLLISLTLPLLYLKYLWAFLGLNLAAARIPSDHRS